MKPVPPPLPGRRPDPALCPALWGCVGERVGPLGARGRQSSDPAGLGLPFPAFPLPLLAWGPAGALRPLRPRLASWEPHCHLHRSASHGGLPQQPLLQAPRASEGPGLLAAVPGIWVALAVPKTWGAQSPLSSAPTCQGLVFGDPAWCSLASSGVQACSAQQKGQNWGGSLWPSALFPPASPQPHWPPQSLTLGVQAAGPRQRVS